MMPSLCESCRNLREVRTARSRFLFCELSITSAEYPKYPPQPVVQCEGFQPKDEAADNATLALSKLVAELDRIQGPALKKRIGFHHNLNQWAVFGGVLNQGSFASVSGVSLGVGERFLVAVCAGLPKPSISS